MRNEKTSKDEDHLVHQYQLAVNALFSLLIIKW